MKCPKCAKEINDEDLFCGYCGQRIEHPVKNDGENRISEEKEAERPTEIASDPPVRQGPEMPQRPETPSRPPKPEKPPKAKMRIGSKILIVFLILALLSGAVLGFLTAKGVIDPSSLFSKPRFEWTDFSEADATESTQDSSDHTDEKADPTENTSQKDADAKLTYPLDPTVMDAAQTARYLSMVIGTWYYEDPDRADALTVSEDGTAILKTVFLGSEAVEERSFRYDNGYFRESIDDAVCFKCVIESEDSMTVYRLNDGTSALFSKEESVS